MQQKNKNAKLVEKILKTFNINKSLSAKGCMIMQLLKQHIKTTFTFNKRFENLKELELELLDYVNRYNNRKTHDSSGYMTPVKFRRFSQKLSKKILSKIFSRIYRHKKSP